MARQAERDALVRTLEKTVGRAAIRDSHVLQAMREVPRHCFVPEEASDSAYEDRALPIGDGQTISQPYVVASMTEALRLNGRQRVLEIGTGSGYQTAILALLALEVYTVEYHPDLSHTAQKRLEALGVENVHHHTGDGHEGLPGAAPFDRIIVTCRGESVPPALLEQLASGGRLLMPLGNEEQQMLTVVERRGDAFAHTALYPVRFVPMLG